MDDISFDSVGTIRVMQKKIEFKNLVVNNEKLVGKNINTVENAFDKYILEDSILGFLDFFKIKKFIFEVSKNLD